MSIRKGDEPMITAAVEEGITDRSQVLSLQAVKAYAERHVKGGRAEYNAGSILVRSKHPLDECLRRGIIEDQHHHAGKRFQSYRDCALSKSSGRVYNATGEGDSEMDAATIYANVLRAMNATLPEKNRWKLIGIICFAEADINGRYLSEADYGALYRLVPDIQYAFEVADEAFGAARKALRSKLDVEKKNREAPDAV